MENGIAWDYYAMNWDRMVVIIMLQTCLEETSSIFSINYPKMVT